MQRIGPILLGVIMGVVLLQAFDGCSDIEIDSVNGTVVAVQDTLSVGVPLALNIVTDEQGNSGVQDTTGVWYFFAEISPDIEFLLQDAGQSLADHPTRFSYQVTKNIEFSPSTDDYQKANAALPKQTFYHEMTISAGEMLSIPAVPLEATIPCTEVRVEGVYEASPPVAVTFYYGGSPIRDGSYVTRIIPNFPSNEPCWGDEDPSLKQGEGDAHF